MKNFFLSLKTTVWTLFVLVCLFFVGSYLMPAHREVFSLMNEDILSRWAGDVALKNVRYTWWLFAALAALVLLTINTISCSLQAVREKWTRVDVLLRLAPQVIHIGFLFILLAHLLGAGWGYRLSGVMPEGAYAPLPEERAVRLHQVRVETDGRGFTTGWAADVSLYENGRLVKTGTLGPNAPLFYQGTGIYVKDLNFDEGPAALMLITKDPGALWALVGGALFLLGALLLTLKWGRPRTTPPSVYTNTN